MGVFETVKSGSFVLFKPSEEQRNAGMKSEEIKMYVFKKMQHEFQKCKNFRSFSNEMDGDVPDHVLREYYKMMMKETANQTFFPTPRPNRQERAPSVLSPVPICQLRFNRPCKCRDRRFCVNRELFVITPREVTPSVEVPRERSPLEETVTPRSVRLRKRSNRDFETSVDDGASSSTPMTRSSRKRAQTDVPDEDFSMDQTRGPRFSTPVNKRRRPNPREMDRSDFDLLDLPLSPIQTNTDTSTSSPIPKSLDSPLGALDVPSRSENFIMGDSQLNSPQNSPALMCVKSEPTGVPPGTHLSISKEDAREFRAIRRKTDAKWAAAFRAKLRDSTILFEELGENMGIFDLLDPSKPTQKKDLLRLDFNAIMDKWASTFDKRGINEDNVERWVFARNELKDKIGLEQARSFLRIFPARHTKVLNAAFEKFPTNYSMFFEETLSVDVASDVIKEFHVQAAEHQLNQLEVSEQELNQLQEDEASRRLDESINFVAHPYGPPAERAPEFQEELPAENGVLAPEEIPRDDEMMAQGPDFDYDVQMMAQDADFGEEIQMIENEMSVEEVPYVEDPDIEVEDDSDIIEVPVPAKNIIIAPIIQLGHDMVPFGGYKEHPVQQAPMEEEVIPVQPRERGFWHEDDEDLMVVDAPEEPRREEMEEIIVIYNENRSQQPKRRQTPKTDPDVLVIGSVTAGGNQSSKKEKKAARLTPSAMDLVLLRGGTADYTSWTADDVYKWAGMLLKLSEGRYTSKERKQDLKRLEKVDGVRLYEMVVKNRWKWGGTSDGFLKIESHFKRIVNESNGYKF